MSNDNAAPETVVERPPLVVFATPCLSNWVSVDYLQSAMATQHLLFTSGISQIWRQVGKDPYLSHVRSRMASEFIDNFPEATDFFFLDDDMGWPAQKVLEFILRPEPLLVGAYPVKETQMKFPIDLAAGEDGKPIWRDGLCQVQLAPTGFMRIKRHVLQAMYDQSGQYLVTDAAIGEVPTRDIFRMGYIEYSDKPGHGRWWGEDFFFSSRWRAMGGEIWCDPDIDFSHRGGHVWRANFKHDGLIAGGHMEPDVAAEAAE